MPVSRFAIPDAVDFHGLEIRRLRRRQRQAESSVDAGMTGVAADCAAMSTRIDAESTTRANADTFLSASIVSEQAARAAADTTNANAVAAETTARTNADAAEVTARNAAITSAVNAEAVSRGNADSAESAARINADAAEITARQNADAALQTSINTKAGRYAATFGNGVLTSFTFTHGLGTADVIVQVYAVAGGGLLTPLSVARTATTVTVTFLAAVSTNGNRIVIIG